MKRGSLVECIKSVKGFALINGEYKRTARDVCKGEILTVSELMPVYDDTGPNGQMCLEFIEIERFIHPVCNVPCGYPPEFFREIQPPMEVTIEQIITQSADI